MNQIQVIGNAVQDGQIRHTKTGVPVGTLRIAVNERYFDKKTNEWKDSTTTFIDVVGWDKKAAQLGDVKKGTKVFTMGKLSVREFDKKDGSKGQSVEISAEQFHEIMHGKSRGDAMAVVAGTRVPTPFEEESLPF
jgi:single-strand DNA-binding protein